MSESFPLLPYVSCTPEKSAAWNSFHAAIAAGRVARGACEVCGSTKRVHGHHPDYARPLDVMWLCPRHHIAWHRENGPGANGGDAEESTRQWGFDWTNQRFGLLLVLAEAPRPDAQRNRRWLCRCDCGRECVKSASYLSRTTKNATVASCAECYAATSGSRRRAKRRAVVAHFTDTGTLYSYHRTVRLEDEIREAFAREFGEIQPEAVPLKTRGLGSLFGGYDFDDGAILADIGTELGVCRERVRQIEEKALGKLRAGFNKKPLHQSATVRTLPKRQNRRAA